MRQKLTIGLLCAAVPLSGLALILGAQSAWLVALTGFVFVVGGTLLTAIASDGYQRVWDLLRGLPGELSGAMPTLGADEEAFMHVAACYRRGSVRQAEMGIKAIRDPSLNMGAQLIVDRCGQQGLVKTLQWHMSNDREQARRRLRILHGMAGFAPAFGMLGTLLGLVRLLFSLGDSGLDVVGAAMGFAMITTVYGLVVANLAIKPVAIKLEQRIREQLAWQKIKQELVLQMFEKGHPDVMRETLNSFAPGRQLVQQRGSNATVTALTNA